MSVKRNKISVMYLVMFHSSEKRGLRSTFWPRETLQILLCLWKKKTQLVFFIFHFKQLWVLPTSRLQDFDFETFREFFRLRDQKTSGSMAPVAPPSLAPLVMPLCLVPPRPQIALLFSHNGNTYYYIIYYLPMCISISIFNG